MLSSNDKIKIVSKHVTQLVSCDGADGTDLECDDEVRISRARYCTKFIRFRETSFLDTLRDRMRYL